MEELGEKTLSEGLFAAGTQTVTPKFWGAADYFSMFRVLTGVTFEIADIGPQFVGVTFQITI